MGLDIPNLDKHNFDTLLEDAINKLPSRAPSWTDYNLSDPGITLIELFAWLNDINSYRLNRISRKHQDAFIKIVNPNRGENIAAKVVLTFTSEHEVSAYNKEEAKKTLIPEKVVLVPKDTEVYQDNLRFLTQSDFLMYPIDFEVISITSKEYGEEKEIPQENFYPFAKTYENDSSFTIHLSHLISTNFSFYVDIYEYADEHNANEILTWFYFDEKDKKWKEILNIKDGSDALRKSGVIDLELERSTSKIKCILKNKTFYETAPIIHKLLINSVSTIQEDSHKVLLTKSDGYVNQNYKLPNSLQKDSIKIKVGIEYWDEVENLKTQKYDSKVFQVKQNHIIFGDGQYGKIPPKDLDIHCDYTSNAGSLGNVIANSIWRAGEISKYDGSVVVTNLKSAFGGNDKLTNKELFEGFQKGLKSIDRAVSLSDYEYLALNTPNTNLEKVKAFVKDGLKDNLNEVTLILVPQSEDLEPQANRYTKEKVKNYLDKKRLITTFVNIQEAKYIDVILTIEIFSQKQNSSELIETIKDILNNYLHPIKGGKDSKGWAFGENLYLSSLYSLLTNIEGIDNIEKLQINGTNDVVLEVSEDTLISSGEYNIDIHGINPVICRS